MKKFPLQIVLFLFYAFVSLKVSGQRNPRIEYINIENGLPQNTVQSIVKDAYGFIWFGTDNGLCRYDGYGFEYYYSNGAEDQLWHNRILHLTTNGKNNLYVTNQRGLQILNLLTGKFVSIHQSKVNLIFKQDVVNSFFDGDNLWVITRTNGIYKLSENANGFEVIGHYWTSEESPSPLNIYKSKEGEMLLGTEAGIFKFDSSKEKFVAYQLNNNTINSETIQSIFDDEENLYIGTTNGMFLCGKQSGAIEWFSHDTNQKNSINHSSVTAISKVSDKILLIGTLGGLSTLDIKSGDVKRFRLFNNREEQYQAEFIRSIYADNQGSIWIGGDKIGLAYFNVHQKNFNSLDNSNPDFAVVNSNIINSIYKSNKNLWVGTAGYGLVRINQESNQTTVYRTQSNNPNSIESNFITSIYKEESNQIWVGTWGMGIQVLQNNGRFKSLHERDGLVGEFISTMYVNRQGDLIVGAQQGLCIYNKHDQQFYQIKPLGGISRDWEVGCIQEDMNGFYWIGTTNGLYRFDGKLVNKDEMTVISRYELVEYKETDYKNSLPNNYITSLTTDIDGNIWMGTYGGGIARCVETSNGNYEFISFGQEDGLANNVVYSVLCDDENHLWITTENGLSKFNIKENHFTNYYRQDGLRNNQYYWSAGFKDKEGNIYIGGLKGLNYFHPNQIYNYPYDTRVAITALNIYNHKVSPGDKYHGQVPLKRASFANDTITLSYKDNVFSLEFSAMNFLHSSKIKYAYRLSGVDKDWVEVDSKRRIASYTNLAGGTYLFQLKSTDLEGVWNDESTEVYIEIIPPFWQEVWFKLLLVLMLIVLGSSYVRYRSFRITMQKKRLEHLVKERTIEIDKKNKQLEETSERLLENNEQLEKRSAKIEKQKVELEEKNKEIVSQRDQLIDLNKQVESIHQMRMQFFTNISHEFRTPLTLILSPIERLLTGKNSALPSGVRNSIEVVKRNAERLLLLTNQILTFRKLEAGKLKIMLHKATLDEVIVEIGEAFKVLADEKDIDYTINVEEADYSGWCDKSKLEDILFNLLANAFKYTPESGIVNLSMRLKPDSNQMKSIEVAVTDSGQGIKTDVIEKVFDRFYRADNNLGFGTGIGLSLVKELVDKQNGNISVSSEYGKGSTFVLELPIDLEGFDNYTVIEDELAESVSMDKKVNLIKKVVEEDQTLQNGDTDKAKVLVVEDNDDLRHFLAESLADEYSVYTAKDGKDGYDLSLKQEVDLVVSDIMMPRLNGLDLCKQLKNNLNTSHLPVILLSAKGMEENQVEGLGVGADDYITKPFNLSLLLAKMKSLIENRQKLKSIYLQDTTGEEELRGGSLDDDFMQKVNAVVSELYADPSFDIETFASKMYVSRSLLYKKLKALTNVSPNEYINVFRLKQSIALLKTKKYQVAEVAVMVGFNDPKYFSRVFKKFYKCSPSEYANS